MTSAPAPGAAAVLSGLEAIWQRYRPAIDNQVTLLEDAAMAMVDGSITPQQRREAEREAHKIAGSVGTYGFAAASATGRDIEYLLQGVEPLPPGDVLRLSELVVALRDQIDGDPALMVPATEESPDRDVLLLVGLEPELAGRVQMSAEGLGWNVRRELRPPTAVPRAVAVVVDASSHREQMLTFVETCANDERPLPVIVLDDAAGLTDRVEVARRGGRAFLPKPVGPQAVLDAVGRAVEQRKRLSTTVLCVDDDPLVLDALSATLGSQGMSVVTLSEPSEFWETLEACRPDVVVLDVDMPGTTGIELCQVLRNDAQWANVPVVFLTGRRDAESIGQMFAAGADDYVGKPLIGPELLTRIGNRLERATLLRDLVNKDPLTGLPNRSAALEAMHGLAATARRERQPYAVALIDVGGLATVNAAQGYATGDRLLRSTAMLLRKHFRADEVIGRWPGGTFAVGMFGLQRTDAAQRCAEWLEAYRVEQAAGAPAAILAASAGVAAVGEDGDDLAAVFDSAERFLADAKRAGGDRVAFAGSESAAEPGSGIDVLVVEDDDVLGSLLEHALETRGYRAQRVADGEQAADRLVGPSATLRPRVVLLDVDLPSLDGLGVLRRLGQAGVLHRTRVIMLTARAAELEVLKALELGAFDHVAKPFSVPVLMQRIRRALEVNPSSASS